MRAAGRLYQEKQMRTQGCGGLCGASPYGYRHAGTEPILQRGLYIVCGKLYASNSSHPVITVMYRMVYQIAFWKSDGASMSRPLSHELNLSRGLELGFLVAFTKIVKTHIYILRWKRI